MASPVVMTNRTGIAIVIAASVVCAAGCSGGSGNLTSSAAVAAGCFTGKYQLHVRPSTAGVGDLVTLSSTGGSPRGLVQSWGFLGKVTSNRQFHPSWNLAAIYSGQPVSANVPIDSTVAESGVALLNRPFQIRVPQVHSGRYLVKFTYTFAGASGRPKNYDLCATVSVGQS